MKNIALIVLILIVQQVHGQLSLDNINGVISFAERQDTLARKYSTNNENYLIRSDKNHIYVGIHSATLSFAGLVFQKGDELIVFHFSGCTGRATYKKLGSDSVVVLKGFYDVTKQPEQWDVVGVYASEFGLKKSKTLAEQKTDTRKCFSTYGYAGSTLDMGSYRDVEVLLDKKVFSGYKMLIQNAVLVPENGKNVREFSYFPSTGVLSDKATMQKFLEAKPDLRLAVNFDYSQWIDLSKLL
jgi:hypothetical protein